MALTDTRELLKKAQNGGYAIGAFNTENMEIMQAVFEAAEETQSPFILQTTPSMLKYATPEVFFGMARGLSLASGVPVALHLDHGNSFAAAAKCLRAGYTSVMIDGSKLGFEENIELAKRVVDMCAPCAVPVEAELGKVGGKEEEVHTDDPDYTDPAEAEDFCRRTGISSLAVAIGTAHGFYKGKPVLDLERLGEIRRRVEIPLVLHGASGLTDEDVQNCVRLGICKVNFATELRNAYTEGVKDTLAGNPLLFDPKEFGKVGRARVKQLVIQRMIVCGAAGKAHA
ncbi:MAG: class II fructose-bisphosphate aldolase [Christensenella sp.]|nr:class II fructose-bisphosphate aldolase [Christensenella sp.]